MPTKTIEELKTMVGESHVRAVNLTVEAGKVEEFARAVHDENAIHRDETAARERGYRTTPAPLTFTRTSRFPRYQPQGLKGYLGFDLGLIQENALHGEQEYEFDRPMYVGDTLTGTTTLTDVFQREGGRGGTMTFFILETEWRDQQDQRVLRERLTIIETAGTVNGDE